ncbi:MAG: tripartite tricarboxylate transporter TctB family protein [Zhengella sp.]|uniref:tripartite tricarboxylate transporter TctB family protein n=1 Tax=Zhengella sp. TaxID=2282762 RepID=UPI001DB9BDA1|nr:tripartite tricarboxylate transporter TctB family protein [Notoacmeibacter sp.]MCC0027148.1 tripartite tricarboxylate transporter TctB family protein [Brucellaceae bacterium]
MRYLVERMEDLIAGLVTALIGVFIIFEASGYKLGTLRSMGPGYFPIMLGGAMVVLALLMIVTARPNDMPPVAGRDQVRGTLFVAAAFIAFAFTVETAGLLVSVFLVVFLSALGNRNTTIKTALVLAAAASILSTLIFRVGLGLQIEAF